MFPTCVCHLKQLCDAVQHIRLSVRYNYYSFEPIKQHLICVFIMDNVTKCKYWCILHTENRMKQQAERVYKHCHQWHSTLHVLLNLMKHCKMKDQNLKENVDWLPITLRFTNEQGGKRVLPDCGWPLTVVKYRIHSLDTHTTQAFILCVVSEGDCLQLC